MPRNTKGSQRERELVNLFHINGWAVIRAPASGGATDRELPDILAGNGNLFVAIEAKTSGGDPIYLSHEEVRALLYFARNFGATALIGVRFDAEYGDPHYANDDDSGSRFFEPDGCYRTESGSSRVKKDVAFESGRRLGDLGGC